MYGVLACLSLMPLSDNNPEVGASDNNATIEAIQGKWEITQLAFNATGSAADYLRRNAKATIVLIQGNRCGIDSSTKKLPFSFTINARTSPKQIDLVDQDGIVYPGVFKLTGDVLTVCIGDNSKRRPTQFDTEDGHVLFVFKRK